MDWNALGAIGEVVGAFGVIASLLYLGLQVRNNTRGTQVAAADAAVQALKDFMAPLVNNPESWNLFWTGCVDLDALTPDQRARWIPIALLWLKTCENVLLKAEQGALQAAVWQGWSVILRSFCSHPGLEAYFDARRVAFTPEFRRWMDAKPAGSVEDMPKMEELAATISSAG